MGFEDFQPIFGQVKVEWVGTDSNTALRPFLFLVNALDPSRLRVHATDFCSSTFEAVRSVLQLEDMKGDIGIGGSWSEFIGYVIASVKSGDVKLVIERNSKFDGAACAKFIAQKSKGLPRISFSLVKLVDAAADEAKANISIELYNAYERMHTSLAKEEERCLQLTKALSAEQEKNDSLRKQVEMVLYTKRHKPQKMNDKAMDSLLGASSQQSPAKQAAQNLVSSKATNRVVPAYRRAKARGALLQDTEDDA